MAKGGPKATKQQENRQHAPAIQDARFSRLHTDPRFLRPNREESKVVIDDRFKGLLTGGVSGKNKGEVDKYGRRVGNKKASTDARDQDEMRRLYRLEKGESEDEASASGSASDSEGSSDEDEEEDVQGTEGFIDYARGEGHLESSGSDSSSEEDYESEEDSEEEAGGVTIGSSSARRKEKQRLRFADEHSEEEDERVQSDLETNLQTLGVEGAELADLDAQAERTVRREAAATKTAAKDAKPERKGDTHRLAAVNMDWDHMRAIDLYKVFSSLVSPAGIDKAGSSNGVVGSAPRKNSQIMPVKGSVVNVRVYPSNFGIERMTKENEEGPPRDIFKRDEDGRVKTRKRSKKSKKNRRGSDDSDDSEEELFGVDEGGEFDEEALRNYQLERLRYYYAIITFDSPQTARYILDEVDGTEMERSANVFDLSFVPEDMTFPEKQASKEDLTDEGWRDEATEITEGGTYKGVDFTTDALRHSKVKLTWDADDPQRTKVTRQLGNQPMTVDSLRDEDFKAYLATDSEGSQAEDDEEEGGGGRNSMRALLGLGDESEEERGTSKFGKSKSKAFEDGRKSRTAGVEDASDRGREMQITFMPGLSEAAERKKKGLAAETQEESTKERYLRKQKEKKERRRMQGRDDDDGAEAAAEDATDQKLGFDDPFFASDQDIDFDEALAAEKNGRGRKEPASAKKNLNGSSKIVSQAAKPAKNARVERSDDDDDDDDDDTAGHFSIKDILKAEQSESGKKSRWAKKKEKKNSKKEGEREQEVQQNFAIDVQDERFQGVFNDHRFALDPSHPSFIKTKNMDKLLTERRKRDKQSRKKDGGGKGDAKGGRLREAEDDASAAGLGDLVQSFKKRSLEKPGDAPRKRSHR